MALFKKLNNAVDVQNVKKQPLTEQEIAKAKSDLFQGKRLELALEEIKK